MLGFYNEEAIVQANFDNRNRCCIYWWRDAFFIRRYAPLVDPAHPKVLACELPSVTLYSTEWCEACSSARYFLNAKKVSCVEKDIEQSSVARQEYDAFGAKGFPFIVVNNTRSQGFDRPLFESVYLSELASE